MEANDYCSYELSKKLKECGFDEPCRKWHNEEIPGTRKEEWDEEECQMVETYDVDVTPIPTLWQAQKWLREKKYLCVTVYAQPYNGLPYYTGYILFDGEETEALDKDGHWFDNYEAALSSTIEAALELIKEKETTNKQHNHGNQNKIRHRRQSMDGKRTQSSGI